MAHLDMHLEAAYRNARLRAWCVYGVPVYGGWEPFGEVTWLFAIGCSDCGRLLAQQLFTPGHYANGKSPAEIERNVAYCDHLAPLLGEDPPEVVALNKLELLAGDPP